MSTASAPPAPAPTGPTKRQKVAEERAAAAESDGIPRWTCEICNVTIAIKGDGFAKTEHLAGKAHAKKARALEGIGTGTTCVVIKDKASAR